MKKRTAPQRLLTLAPAAVSSAWKSRVAIFRSLLTALISVLDARIQGRVQHVDDEVNRDNNHRDEHHEILNHRIIAPAHRLDEKARDAGDVEYGLDDNQPAQQKSGLDADHRNHR